MTDKVFAILGITTVGAALAVIMAALAIAEYRKMPKPPFPVCQQRIEP